MGAMKLTEDMKIRAAKRRAMEEGETIWDEESRQSTGEAQRGVRDMAAAFPTNQG